MVNYVLGDLFDTDADIIAHGVNCKGSFGSGIAGLMNRYYPPVRREYLDKFDTEGWKLGDTQFVRLVNVKGYIYTIIANCATQDDYGYKGVCHASYPAIRECMTKVKEYARQDNLTIAIPTIGCGLAGGDWNIVKGILEEVFTDYDITVYYLEIK